MSTFSRTLQIHGRKLRGWVKMYLDPQNTVTLLRDSAGVVNLGLSYTSSDENWAFSVGGQNVGDERYLVNGFAYDAVGIHIGSYNRPAEWYASLKFNY